MKADKNNSIGRFRIIFLVMCLAGLYILGSALHTMLPPTSEYWEKVSKRFIKENLPIPATRGNIYSWDGQLLAGSIPEYRLYLDYVVIDRDSIARVKAQAWRDSAFQQDLDSISLGLARIFPDKSPEWFRQRLLEGKKRKSHAWRIYPGHASYIQYKECKKLPLLRETSFRGGFYVEEQMKRKRPYGSLASRTLGDLYRDSDAAKNGLELSFDSILSGKPGISHRTKIRNKRLSFTDLEPEDGHDIVSTIDVNIQDVAEKAIVNKLKEVKGETGIVIVMEVATGDVKAIVNMTRGQDSLYYEMKNNAISDLMEPGSTFKTASIMVGLEDGTISMDDVVDCTGGIYNMHGRWMKDHNWRKGGYGVLSVSQVLEYSSNIGVSKLIDKAYHDQPEKFVQGLNREGVGLLLDLPFKGKGEPIVPHPKDTKRYWSKTDLPWMSIGYVTMLPPISTLTFYNAIANGGRMVKPRFIKAEMKDGIIVKEYPTEVLKQRICSPKTLDNIQLILERVVSRGLGKKAGNGGKLFKVSGKTGTAQIAKANGGGYHSGIPRYMVSFCGYYPSDAPKYSCIVCIVKNGLPASGGGQCGPVFREISEYVMSSGDHRNIETAADSNSVYVPEITLGNKRDAQDIIKKMKLEQVSVEEEMIDTIPEDKVPNVAGMGAKDAVYLLQQRGLKVRLNGAGEVQQQSIPPGSEAIRGKTITLVLKERKQSE